MIFLYWDIVREGVPRRVPLIPLTVHGPHKSVQVLALVDSGAEHSVFGTDLVDRLELSLDAAIPVGVVGVGEHEIGGHLISLQLQLGSYRWSAPAIFTPGVQQRAVLGQAGLFAFFNVTFRYRRGEIEIRRAR